MSSFYMPKVGARKFILQFFKDRGIKRLSGLSIKQLFGKYVEYRRSNG